jgi:hypothetical protein
LAGHHDTKPSLQRLVAEEANTEKIAPDLDLIKEIAPLQVCSPSEDECRVSLTHERDGGKGDRLLSLCILHLPPHLYLGEEAKGSNQ